MTTPAMVEQDPLEQLKALKASQVGAADDPLEQLKAMRATVPLGHDFHAEYASGKLAPRMASENVHEDAPEAPDQASYGQRALGGLASFGHAIPGVEAAQAGTRALVRTGANKLGLPVAAEGYRDALSNIKQGEAASGGVGKVNSLLGGAIAAGALPGGPATQGAIFGGAEGLLNSDPDSDISNRLKRGVVGAGVGALTGKALDLGITGVRAKLAPEPTANLVARDAARSAASKPLYKQFRDLGDLGRTPELDALLGTPASPLAGGSPGADGLPIIRRAIDAVKGESPTLANLPDTDARVLDAVYKRVGNKAFAAQHGFEPGEARDALREAMDKAAQAKGGSYAEPLAAYRQGSEGINAVTRGRDALQNAVSKSGGSEKAALNKSPAAFNRWLESASPENAAAAGEGVLGQAGRGSLVNFGRVLGTPIIPHPSPQLSAASALMRPIDAGNNLYPMLRALGIVGATAPVQP